MSIHTEDWDSATPPIVPAGWNASASLETTASFLGGITPTSSPNALQQSLGTINVDYVATYTTPDTNGGDVVVSANVNWWYSTTISASAVFGLIARGDGSSLSFAFSTFYWATIDFVVGSLNIFRVITGATTSIASISTTALDRTKWYQLVFSLNGTSLSLSIQRLSDGQWMDSSGNFQSFSQVAISTTDSSISGAGYAGLTAGASSTVGQSAIYTDDWDFADFAAPPPPTTHAAMYDRVKESSLTLGTGPMLLLGAETGYQSFAVVGDGNYVYYGIADQLSNDWEVGLGSYDASGPSLNRLVVYDSSVGPGAFVDFQTGSYKSIFNTVPAWLLNSLMGLL